MWHFRRICQISSNKRQHNPGSWINIGCVVLAERGFATVVVEREVRIVGVGMSLVFNTALLFEGIPSVYAGSNGPQIEQNQQQD